VASIVTLRKYLKVYLHIGAVMRNFANFILC
jgi:hypothetical protein